MVDNITSVVSVIGEASKKGKTMSQFKSPTIWTGNTYLIRDAIKSLGGRWDAERKAWRVPALSMRERSQVYCLCGGLKGVTIAAA